MTSEELLVLVKTYFRPTTFTHGELKMLAELCLRVPYAWLESVFRTVIEQEQRPTYRLIKARLRSYSSIPGKEPVESDPCALCYDMGYLEVELEGQSKTLVTRCSCPLGLRPDFLYDKDIVRLGSEFTKGCKPIPIESWSMNRVKNVRDNTDFKSIIELWKKKVSHSEAAWMRIIKGF